MARSTSSIDSQSQVNSSPSQSLHRKPGSDISIETLISYLVAAKRSLSSIDLVHHATTVLSTARSTIETTAALVARNKFLRRSLASQLKILRGIQFEIEGAAQSIKTDIQVVLAELEQTDKELSERVQILTETRIEEGFKSRKPDNEGGHLPDKHSLHDFVDDEPIDALRTGIQAAIDIVEDAEIKVDQSMRKLEDDLQCINEALSNEHPFTVGLSTSGSSSEVRRPHISIILRTLEEHAHEMAISLESLVKHFDLCVTAIKHTEGAGAVVAQTINVGDLPEGFDVGVDDLSELPAEHLADDERDEMLTVLANDAADVHDVMSELQDRHAEMELKLDQIMHWRDNSEAAYNDILTAYKLLEKVGSELPHHAAENAQFANRWMQQKPKIEDGIAGMGDLCEVYDKFLDAYDGLIVEAARRRTVKKKMEKVVREAQVELEKLYEDDLNERELFRTEQGDFLPSDIWKGLASLPPRYLWTKIDNSSLERSGEDEGGHDSEIVVEDSIPDLPRKTVEEALRRLRSGGRRA